MAVDKSYVKKDVRSIATYFKMANDWSCQKHMTQVYRRRVLTFRKVLEETKILSRKVGVVNDPVRGHSVYRIKLEDNKSICDFFNLCFLFGRISSTGNERNMWIIL